jgi:arylformamidase
MSQRRIIDLSQDLSEQTPAFPGDPSLKITVLDSTATASTAGERHLNSSHLSMGLHCGTHMDAPYHFFEDGETIDRTPLAWYVGPALLIRLPCDAHGMTIEPHHLAPHAAQLRGLGRVVLNTGWHHRWGREDYFVAHPVISGAAAQFMVDCGVRLVGVDTPSVDRPPYDAHLAFLGAGTLIVENLTNLDAITSDVFELIVVPLKILGRDASPVRALAVENDAGSS